MGATATSGRGTIGPAVARSDIALLFTARALRMFGYGFLALVLVLYGSFRRLRPPEEHPA